MPAKIRLNSSAIEHISRGTTKPLLRGSGWHSGGVHQGPSFDTNNSCDICQIACWCPVSQDGSGDDDNSLLPPLEGLADFDLLLVANVWEIQDQELVRLEAPFLCFDGAKSGSVGIRHDKTSSCQQQVLIVRSPSVTVPLL